MRLGSAIVASIIALTSPHAFLSAKSNSSSVGHANTLIYGNIDKGDFTEIKESMFDEITGLTKTKLNHSAKVTGQLYEFLHKNNQDLTEDDFGDLLYDYLEGDLTIESLKSKYNLEDSIIKTIKTKLLFGQEINSKELEKKVKQLEEEVKIKGITAEIQQNSAEIQQNSAEIQQNSAEIQQNSADIQQNSDIIEEENKKQEEENKKQKNGNKWLKASEKWEKDLNAMSKKLGG